MKSILYWIRFLIGCLYLALITACTPAIPDTLAPEPTAPAVSEMPLPEPTLTPLPFIEGTEFPTGKFEHVGGHYVIEFREDGTSVWYTERQGGSYPTRYGVSGNYYAEMIFSYPSGRQVPGTYFWNYDGELLTFQVWGKDLRSTRFGMIHGQSYRFIGEAEPASTTDAPEFPTGRFINEAGPGAFEFDEDGTWRFFEEVLGEPVRTGRYATSGKYYTEMTHDDPDLPKVPATYFWAFDGQKLSFKVWKEEVIEQRKGVYDGQSYTLVDE